MRFRPLSGYLISKYDRGIFKESREDEVSVPSRGILFPNRFFRSWRIRTGIVSVPSRGILFPNEYRHRPIKRSWPCFRPLSGYLISKLTSIKWWCLTHQSFRPLSGYLISKFDILRLVYGYTATRFPSPLGVSYFQINYDYNYKHNERFYTVSVPSRGILFPNRKKKDNG